MISQRVLNLKDMEILAKKEAEEVTKFKEAEIGM